MLWIIALICLDWLGLLAYYFSRPEHITHFFVTAVEMDGDTIKATRCVGYEATFKAAEKAILENRGDLHESSNQWAVIEEMVMGVWSSSAQCRFGKGVYQWYRWEGDDNGRYVKCCVPSWAINTLNWSIG